MALEKINIKVIANGFIVSRKRIRSSEFPREFTISESYASKDDLAATIGKIILESTEIEQLGESGYKNGNQHSYIEFEVNTNRENSCFSEENDK
jgi:hypothetical protein